MLFKCRGFEHLDYQNNSFVYEMNEPWLPPYLQIVVWRK